MSSKGVWRQPRGPTPRATALVALAGFLDRTLGTVSVADVKEAAYTTWQQCAEAAEIRHSLLIHFLPLHNIRQEYGNRWF